MLNDGAGREHVYISGGQLGWLYSWRRHRGGGMFGAQPTPVWLSVHSSTTCCPQTNLVSNSISRTTGTVWKCRSWTVQKRKFWQYCTDIDERQQCSTNTSSLPPCRVTQPFLISLGVCLHSSQLSCHCEIPWHFHDSSRHIYPCCITTSCTTVLSLLPAQYKYWCTFYKNVHVQWCSKQQTP